MCLGWFFRFDEYNLTGMKKFIMCINHPKLDHREMTLCGWQLPAPPSPPPPLCVTATGVMVVECLELSTSLSAWTDQLCSDTSQAICFMTLFDTTHPPKYVVWYRPNIYVIWYHPPTQICHKYWDKPKEWVFFNRVQLFSFFAAKWQFESLWRSTETNVQPSTSTARHLTIPGGGRVWHLGHRRWCHWYWGCAWFCH